MKLRERMEVVLNFAYDLKEGKIRNVILTLSVKIRGALKNVYFERIFKIHRDI